MVYCSMRPWRIVRLWEAARVANFQSFQAAHCSWWAWRCQTDRKTMGKSWENHGEIMGNDGKSWMHQWYYEVYHEVYHEVIQKKPWYSMTANLEQCTSR